MQTPQLYARNAVLSKSSAGPAQLQQQVLPAALGGPTCSAMAAGAPSRHVSAAAALDASPMYVCPAILYRWCSRSTGMQSFKGAVTDVICVDGTVPAQHRSSVTLPLAYMM
jgi:hypothetical protein